MLKLSNRTILLVVALGLAGLITTQIPYLNGVALATSGYPTPKPLPKGKKKP